MSETNNIPAIEELQKSIMKTHIEAFLSEEKSNAEKAEIITNDILSLLKGIEEKIKWLEKRFSWMEKSLFFLEKSFLEK